MTEPSPQYRHTPSGDELHAIDLELLERTHTAALYAVWKAQGKRKKIINLPPESSEIDWNSLRTDRYGTVQVDTPGDNVVVLQHSN